MSCSRCDTANGFHHEGDHICALPLELLMQTVFIVVVCALAILTMLIIGMKMWLVSVYSKLPKNGRFTAALQSCGGVTPSLIEDVNDSIEANFKPCMDDEDRDATREAIKYAIERARCARNMDWNDPELPEDAAYMSLESTESPKGYMASMPVERLVPREYPWNVDVHTKAVMGVGMPLFFNFHILPFAMGLLLLALTGFASWHSKLYIARAAMDSEAAFEPDAKKITAAVELYAQVMWYGLGVLHLILLVVSLSFARFQWRFAKYFDRHNSTMRDYAVILNNLPRNLISEKLLTEHCEKQFGVSLVGTSIAIDCYEKGLEDMGTVGDMLWQMRERLVINYDTKFDKTRVDGLNPEYRFGYDPDLALSEDKEDFKHDGERFRNLLEMGMLKGSGYGVAVFRRKADTKAAMAKAKGFHIDGQEITCETCRFEPTGVEWLNFGTPPPLRRMRARIGALIILSVFFVICAAVYYPINRHISLPYAINKASPQTLTSQCIGVINGIVGAALCPMLFAVAGRIGYIFKSEFDMWCLQFCVINSIINFCFGNYAILYSYLLDGMSAIHVRDRINAEQVHDELRLSDFYLDLLFPGMILTGWLIGKLMGDVWPFVQHFFTTYLVFVWKPLPDTINRCVATAIPYNPRVFGKDGVTRLPLSAREAEFIWAPKDFSVAWEYADKIWNPTICCMTLFVLSDASWIVFAALLGWLGIVYLWQRFVQFRTYAKYMAPLTDVELLAQRCWSLPLSTIAAAWCYWGYRLGRCDWKWACPAAALSSALFFNVGLTVIHDAWIKADRRHDWDEAEEMYTTTFQRLQYNWFNCNPAYVFKSHYARETLGEQSMVEPLAPFFYGKEYLQLDAPRACPRNESQATRDSD